LLFEGTRISAKGDTEAVLTCTMNKLHTTTTSSHRCSSSSSICISICGLKALESQLKETQKLSDMYREQVIALEDKLAHIREEGDVGKELFKVCHFFVYLVRDYYGTPRLVCS